MKICNLSRPGFEPSDWRTCVLTTRPLRLSKKNVCCSECLLTQCCLSQMTTPTMIMLGADDRRVPNHQGHMLLQALQARGVESRSEPLPTLLYPLIPHPSPSILLSPSPSHPSPLYCLCFPCTPSLAFTPPPNIRLSNRLR